MIFNELPSFRKEVKRYSKRFISLGGDLKLLYRVIEKIPEGNKSKHWDILQVSDDGLVTVLKVRVACRSLKGTTRLRLIYAVNRTGIADAIDLIELYLKGDKANEDRKRIKDYLSSF